MVSWIKDHNGKAGFRANCLSRRVYATVIALTGMSEIREGIIAARIQRNNVFDDKIIGRIVHRGEAVLAKPQRAIFNGPPFGSGSLSASQPFFAT